jgi:hypothetical protein
MKNSIVRFCVAVCLAAANVGTGQMRTYLNTGRPLIPCLWASAPHDGFGSPAETWIAASQQQADWCREKNLPIMLYAVGQPNMSPNDWNTDPDCAVWRDWVFQQLRPDTRRQSYPAICEVGLADLTHFVEDWLLTGIHLDGDLNATNRVDLSDFKVLSGYWTGECPENWPLK